MKKRRVATPPPKSEEASPEKRHNDGRGPYGAIYRSLWYQESFRSLSYHAKAAWCYLRTCPLGDSLIGIFPFHSDAIASDLGMPPECVEPALAELERAHFIMRAPGWMWVVWQFGASPGVTLANPKQRTAMERGLSHSPFVLASTFRAFYLHGIDPQPDSLPDSLPDTHSGTHSQDGYAIGYRDHVPRTTNGEPGIEGKAEHQSQGPVIGEGGSESEGDERPMGEREIAELFDVDEDED